MTPRETLRFNVHALNRFGVKAEMRIVERGGKLMLLDGLATYSLETLPNAWTAPELEAEITRLTGAMRVIVA